MDVFRVGVSIAMSSNANAVLGIIQRDLFGLRRAVDLTTGKLNTLKLAAVGAMSALAGGAALKGMWSLVDAGKELVHQQSLLRIAAVSNIEIAQATGVAWKIAGEVAGTTAVGNIKMLADLRNVMGSMEHAAQIAPEMAKVGVVLSSVTGKNGEEGAYQFARFLELRGALIDPKTHEISPERLQAQMRLGTAIIAGTRGRVGPAELLAFQQQARAAGAMLSDDGLLDAVPLIQASGGFRAGTMMAAITQQLTGGVMTQRSAGWLVEHGLLPKQAVTVGRGGQVTIDKKQLAGADMLASDPGAWAVKVLQAKLAAQGYVDQDAQTRIMMESGLRQTTVGGLVEFVRNSASFAKEVANIRAALGVNQYDLLFGRGQTPSDGRRDRDSYDPRTATKVPLDPTVTMEAFHKAWDNLMTSLGAPLVETAMQMVTKITGVFTDISQWAAKNEGTVLILGEVAAAVSGAAIAFGLFAVGTAAASALGLLTGAAGLGALAAGIVAAGHALGVLPDWVVKIAAGGIIGARLGGLPGALTGALISPAISAGDFIGENLREGYKSVTGSYPGYSPTTSKDGRPIDVNVINSDQVGKAAGGAARDGTVSWLGRALNKPNVGTVNPDLRVSPFALGVP